MNVQQDAVARHANARALVSTLIELQAETLKTIARCPGQSMSRKRAVFTRLQRVRSHIAACAHEDLDIPNLAFAANYSVGRFITIFRTVYGETPYSCINRHRLNSASALLAQSDLAIGEISQSTGFPNQTSFNTALKRRFGQSATEFRAHSNRNLRHQRGKSAQS
ncbi:MAG: helix-turn-helix transcriptional regulator [Rudaea sp.]